MSFKLTNLKRILPDAYLRRGENFILQIGETVINSQSLEQLEKDVLDLFSRVGLDYEQMKDNHFLKGGEVEEEETESQSRPIQNEMIEVVSQQIDTKAQEFKQLLPDLDDSE